MNIGRVITALLLTGLIANGAYAADQTAGQRVIEVIADKDNTFKVPGEKKPILTVKPGEQIVLRITSHFGGEQARDGAQHSFVAKKTPRSRLGHTPERRDP